MSPAVEAAGWLARFGPAIAAAIQALAADVVAPSIVLGALFVPSSDGVVDEGPVPGRADMTYRWARDEADVTFKVLIDGQWRTLLVGTQSETNVYRDSSGDIIARAVLGAGGRLTLVADVASLDRAAADKQAGAAVGGDAAGSGADVSNGPDQIYVDPATGRTMVVPSGTDPATLPPGFVPMGSETPVKPVGPPTSGADRQDQPLWLATLADPARDYFGPAAQSNPVELQQLIDRLEAMGVKIENNDTFNMAYGPNPTTGSPGTIRMDPEASYSAWLHEAQHAFDDQASGWQGMRLIFDYATRLEWEESAYGIEIERAVNLGNDDLAAQLEALLAVEKRRLDQDFGKRFLPKGVAMDDEFANVSDAGLQEIIHDKRNGLVRARAIRELARRALSNHALLDDACRAISSDHEATGHHKPLGWAGADVIFLAGDRAAMAALLKEIKNWNLGDQRFLLLRWDVLNTEATIRDFESKYDCKINFPPYKKPESLTLPTKRRDERD